MQLLKRLLPNRADGFWLLVMILLVTTAMVFQVASWAWQPATVFVFSMPFAVCATAILLALGVVAGWSRVFWPRWIGLLVCCLLCVLVSAFQLQESSTYVRFDSDSLNEFVPRPVRSEISRVFTNGGWNLTIWLVGLIVAGLAVYFTRMLWRGWNLLRQRHNLNRQRILVIVAAVLMVVGIASNIATANGTSLSAAGSLAFRGVTLVEVAQLALMFLAFLFWPGYVFTRPAKWWTKAAVLLMFAATVVGFWFLCLFSQYSGVKDYAMCISAALGSCVFLLSLVLVSKVSHEQSEGQTPRDSWWPTPWILLASLPLAVPVVLPSLDLATLIRYQASGGKSIGAAESVWTVARTTAKSNRLSQGKMLIKHFRSPNPMARQYSLNCNDAPDDILRHAYDKGTEHFLIENINIGLETVWIRDRVKSFHLIQGEITKKQLADMCNSAVGLVYLDSVKIVDDGSQFSPAVTGAVEIRCSLHAKGDLRKILDSISPIENVQSLTFMRTIDEEDWLAAVAASKLTKLEIASPRWYNISGSDSISLDKICLYDGPLAAGATELKLAGASSWPYEPYAFSGPSSQVYWDFVFAVDFLDVKIYPDQYRDIKRAFRRSPPDKKKIEFSRLLTERHLAFGFDKEGNISKLYAPRGESIEAIGKLTELKSLSFDDAWINENSQPSNFGEQVPHLKSLTKMEQLWFPNRNAGFKCSFLAEMKKLKHLQITSRLRYRNELPIPDSLETLVMWGSPKPKLVRDLKKLSSLKELTLVVNEIDMPIKSLQARIQEVLPSVKVKVVYQYEFDSKPKAPAAFLEHRKRVKEKLIQEFKTATESRDSKK